MRNHKNAKTVEPEFSRPFDISRLSPGGGEVHERLDASPDERAALCRRFGLLGMGKIDGIVRLRRMKGKGMRIRVSGHLHADVVQACVVTLEPVEETVDEDFTILFSDEVSGTDEAFSVDDDSEPADFMDGRLDLGEMLAQQLSLALNPYPRKEDARINEGNAFQGLQTE